MTYSNPLTARPSAPRKNVSSAVTAAAPAFWRTMPHLFAFQVCHLQFAVFPRRLRLFAFFIFIFDILSPLPPAQENAGQIWSCPA
jgi:hypothetical protein